MTDFRVGLEHNHHTRLETRAELTEASVGLFEQANTDLAGLVHHRSAERDQLLAERNQLLAERAQLIVQRHQLRQQLADGVQPCQR